MEDKKGRKTRRTNYNAEVIIELSGERIDLVEFIESVLDFEEGE